MLLAGHLDTVPIADNVPSRREGGLLYGCGASDMKAGDAVIAHLAATVTEPAYDVTCVFYDCEEVEADAQRARPDRARAPGLAGGRPGRAGRADRRDARGRVPGHRCGWRSGPTGRRAHSARSWLGDNAIHHAGDVLSRLAGVRRRGSVDIDGCVYREGLQAVRIAGGVAGNVVPDECVVTINFRFAPDRSTDDAVAHVREVLDGYPFAVTDLSPGALPGLSAPAAAEFVAGQRGRARGRSTAGPTCPGSPRSASPR